VAGIYEQNMQVDMDLQQKRHQMEAAKKMVR
jgi:hypothetical protein